MVLVFWANGSPSAIRQLSVCLSCNVDVLWQMVRWIKMLVVGWIEILLGTAVGRGTIHVALDGFPAPPFTERVITAVSSPTFGSCLLWPNGRMDQDTAWYVVRPPTAPRRRVTCGSLSPASPPLKGVQQPPLFRPCLFWPNDLPSHQLLSSCCTAVTRWMWTLRCFKSMKVLT